MQLKENEKFNKCVDAFKKLSIREKHKIVTEEAKKTIDMFDKVFNEANYEILYNREILDMNSENYTEEDFIEAMYVYMTIIQELSADYILKNNEIKRPQSQL